jgi:hypothetical protein
LRWYSVAPIANLLPAMALAVGKERFRADASEGFVPVTTTKTRIEAAFVERVAVEEKIEDPFGTITVYERVDYRRTEFILGSTYPELQLCNAPRSSRGFIARLGEASGHTVSIQAVPLDVMAIVSHLEREIGRVSVTSLVVGGFPLSSRASADIVVSGAEDIREEARKFTAHRFATVSAATVSWHRRSGAVECNIAVGGVAFDGERGDRIEKTFRDALAETRVATHPGRGLE